MTSRAVTSIAGAIVALVVVAAAIVLVATNRGAAQFPDGSPQRAMQDYLAAWKDHDLDTAYGFFSTAVRSASSLADYRRSVDGEASAFPGEEEAIYIDGVEGSGDRITLHLTVEHYVSGQGGESYRTPATVPMVREADGWKLDRLVIGVEPGPLPFDESL